MTIQSGKANGVGVSINRVTATTTTAAIDPADTYRVARVTLTHASRATANGTGTSTATTPAPVATPFPPLNFR